jgi:Ribonuclease G/E
MAEAGRYKRAWCRPTDELPCPAPSLADALRAAGETVEVVRQFPAEGWEDVAADALTGTIDFAGGILIAALTPAMTVIDIDGSLPPRELAIAGAQATAKAIRRLDLAGSIGIDFPTLGRKEDRRAVDEALARALGSWPHERTAMNGFGFVQIVARLERPSLLHRFTQDRTGAAARMALRRAERVSEPGDLLVTVHPAVRMAMDMGWESDLRRRTGRDIRWQVDPGIALEAGFAQAVAR